MAARVLCRKGRVAAAVHITQLNFGRRAGLVDQLMVRKLEEAGWVPSMAARGRVIFFSSHHNEANHSDGRKVFHVDTFAKVRKLEAQGLPSKQADAIVLAITGMQHDFLKDMAQSIFKAEMQKEEMILDEKLSNLKFEVLRAQATHYSLMQGEFEKVYLLLDEIRVQSRYKLDRAIGQQCLEVEAFKAKAYHKIHEANAHLKASKYKVIKYCIGTLVTISACVASVRFAI